MASGEGLVMKEKESPNSPHISTSVRDMEKHLNSEDDYYTIKIYQCERWHILKHTILFFMLPVLIGTLEDQE